MRASHESTMKQPTFTRKQSRVEDVSVVSPHSVHIPRACVLGVTMSHVSDQKNGNKRLKLTLNGLCTNVTLNY